MYNFGEHTLPLAARYLISFSLFNESTVESPIIDASSNLHICTSNLHRDEMSSKHALRV